MDPKVEIPKDTNKLKQQIKILEYQLDQDITEKDIKIHKAAFKILQEELLFREYLKLQSNEFKKDLIGYEPLSMQGKDVAIKVKFKSFWLHVFRTKSGAIEWY